MKRSSFITWEQLKVGSLIVAGLVVLGAAVYKLGKATNLFHRRYELLVYLSNASGLVAGGPVYVAGQFAGTIRSIEFLPVDNDTTRNLRVRVAVDQDLQEQIRGDSKASIRTMGLLGAKMIDISTGTPKFPALRAGDSIRVAKSLDYDAVLAQASGAVQDMVGLTHDLRAITGGIVQGKGTVGQLMTNRALYDQFVATMARANSMLTEFQNPNGTLGRMLNDPTAYDRFVGVLTSADSLVVALNDKQGTLGKLLRDDTLYTRLVGMAVAGDSLMHMLSSGQGLAGRLLNDPTAYDRLDKLITDLTAILDDVRKDPRKYTKGAIQVCVLHCK